MDPRVIAAFTAHGVLTRWQVLDLGVPVTEVRRFLRTGAWIVVRRGVYTTREIWAAADEYVARPRLRARAAIASVRRGWVLSHDSAAHELGMAILHPREPYVHLTRPGWTNAWTENEVKHHLAAFDDSQVRTIDGFRVLDPARTGVDIARERGRQDGLVACDAARRAGATRGELVAAAGAMFQWPGSIAARWAAANADPGAENPHESLTRELVIEAGIGEPSTQFPVLTSEGVRWGDVQVGNHIIEADGRVKYVAIAAGGVADRPAAEVVFEERKRERLLADRGLVITRVYWEDHWGSRRGAAIRRLRADHADSVARYGAGLDPRLATEAAQLRSSYGGRRRA